MNFRKESMRIGGERVARERVIEVHNPSTGECIGSVPKATVADVQRAFDIAQAYRPRLSRHQRYEILQRAADLVVARSEEISDLITCLLYTSRCV